MLDGTLDAVVGSGVLLESEVADLKMNHTKDLFVSLSPAIQNRIVVLNTNKAPTNSLDNRKVIIHAINKAAIIDKELAGLDEPAESLFPKDAPYSGAHLTPIPDYDLEKATLINCPMA